ncbi:MAG TPA: hypothetical protein VGM39_03445 [Kofleriaceae bacterium]|jgi:hypothetical protein
MLTRLSFALLLFAGCSNVCAEEPVAGKAFTDSVVTGSVDVEMATGPMHAAFGDSELGGTVYDDYAPSVTLGITAGIVSLGSDAPDVRDLANGAHVTLAMDGAIVIGTDGYCNITGTTDLTVTQATGDAAPYPDFATDDFSRTATIEIHATTFAAGSYGDSPAPACPTSLVAHGTVEVTKASYRLDYETVNCPDVSR